MKNSFGSHGTKDMSLALGILIVLISSTRSVSADKDETNLGDIVQYVDGDILIAVYLPISYDYLYDSSGSCNRSFAHPEMAEQVNMFLKKVNSNKRILPGVKLGAVVINTCYSGSHSTLQSYDAFLNPYVLDGSCSRPHCLQGKRILAGVVGAASSDVTRALVPFMNDFQIPQVSYWSTDSRLSDKEEFESFFRTVPSNTAQTKAMGNFIHAMGWSLVAVVYTDDAYGNDGYKEIKKYFPMNHICFGMEISVTNDSVSSVVDNILLRRGAAQAVVLYVNAPIARKILSTAAKKGGEHIIWIASDAWATMSVDDSFKYTAHGTIGFSPKFPSIEKVNRRMQELTIQDYTGEKAILNPWWQEYLQRKKNCATKEGVGKRLCKADERLPEYHASPNGLDDAMSVFVHALHEYHKTTCNAAHGMCDELSRKAGTADVAKELVPYVQDVAFLTDDKKRVVKFDENGDVPPLYDIFAFDQFRPKSLSNGWRNVGSYNDIYGSDIRKQELPQKVRDGWSFIYGCFAS